MFSLINEITSNLSSEEIKKSAAYKIINIGGNALYVQGYKTIDKFRLDAISLVIKNGIIFIKGENFKIKELGQGVIYIIGKINSIEVV